MPESQWDEIFDVVVVGSGGGALTAALLAARGGASTLVVEKDEFFGGTTAVSGVLSQCSAGTRKVAATERAAGTVLYPA